MATPAVQRVAAEAALARLGSSGSCQRLRKSATVVIGRGHAGLVKVVVRRLNFERGVSSRALEAATVSTAIGDQSSSPTVTAPATAGGASVATRKKPMNGYLNKVRELVYSYGPVCMQTSVRVGL